MTRVACVTNPPALAMLAAAVDAGVLAPADRTLVLLADTGPEPEATPAFGPESRALAGRLGEVVDWNAFLAPLHPAAWAPADGELPLLRRLLAGGLGLDGPVELVLDGLHAAPGRTLADLLPGPVTVLCDSLAAWGPPPVPLTGELAGRARLLLHLPVLGALTPHLLADADGAETRAVPADALAAALATWPAPAVPDGAVLVLAGPGGTPDLADMLRRVAAAGHRSVLVVLRGAAVPRVDGLEVTVVPDGVPAEAVLAGARPSLVVGGVDAALVLARDVHGLPVAAVGAEDALARRRPDAARTPAAIVHAALPRLGITGAVDDPPPVDLPALVDAVAHSVASDALADLRPAAQAYLAAHGGGPYVPADRLVALGFTPAPPPGVTDWARARSHGALRRARRAVRARTRTVRSRS